MAKISEKKKNSLVKKAYKVVDKCSDTMMLSANRKMNGWKSSAGIQPRIELVNDTIKELYDVERAMFLSGEVSEETYKQEVEKVKNAKTFIDKLYKDIKSS